MWAFCNFKTEETWPRTLQPKGPKKVGSFGYNTSWAAHWARLGPSTILQLRNNEDALIIPPCSQLPGLLWFWEARS